jgi:hypothetical protein
MSAGRPRLPDSAVRIRNSLRPVNASELMIVADIRERVRNRGSSKRVAHETGISRSHLLSIANGNARVGLRTARRLGYQPVYERILIEEADAEDARLANKVEAELNRPSLLKEGE